MGKEPAEPRGLALVDPAFITRQSAMRSLRLPNLLATPRGRLLSFFCLYLSEGMPLGFAVTAVATHLRRLEIGPAEIGLFVASFYLPWGFKWLFGPLIDTVESERLGRRRGWILACQVTMAVTLASLVFVDLPAQLAAFTALLFVHNVFGAMQDVAIDALACSVLQEDERGTANGLMLAGAFTGQAIGGAGMLWAASVVGFQASFGIVAAAILAVTIFVVLPMRGPRNGAQPLPPAASRGFQQALSRMRALLGSRASLAAVVYALLPVGALSLGLLLQSNLPVQLGFGDASFASLQAASTVITAATCVLGGWLSDRFGRRRMLAAFVLLMSLPVLLLAAMLHRQGSGAGAQLANAFCAACLAYSLFQGLAYGSNTALLMDLTEPGVAATQFTAYMALQTWRSRTARRGKARPSRLGVIRRRWRSMRSSA